MTLQEFLRLINDEEQLCYLEIDKGDESEYDYVSFWLSDFRNNASRVNNWKDYIVLSFRIEDGDRLTIEVKKV